MFRIDQMHIFDTSFQTPYVQNSLMKNQPWDGTYMKNMFNWFGLYICNKNNYFWIFSKYSKAVNRFLIWWDDFGLKIDYKCS